MNIFKDLVNDIKKVYVSDDSKIKTNVRVFTNNLDQLCFSLILYDSEILINSKILNSELDVFVDFNLLHKVLTKCKDVKSFDKINENLVIKTDKINQNIKIIESNTLISKVDMTNMSECNNIVKSLDAVKYAAGVDDIRYYLNSVIITKNGIAASNGHILAKDQVKTNVDYNLLIPIDFVNVIVGIFKNESNVKVFYNKEFIIFKSDNITYLCRLLDNSYPDFNKIIDNTVKTECLTFENNDFFNTVDQLCLQSDKKVLNIVNFELSQNVLHIGLYEKEYCKSDVGFASDVVANISNKIDCKLLLNVAKQLKNKTVTVSLSNVFVLFQCDNVSHIIMLLKV